VSQFATLEELRLMKRDELIMEIERYADAIAIGEGKKAKFDEEAAVAAGYHSRAFIYMFLEAVKQIRAKVRMVAADPPSFGVLSTGEKCAVALVLDDPALVKWWGTMLDCVDRLEGDWIKAAIYVQRNGWDT
jgi:hypothetical protein